MAKKRENKKLKVQIKIGIENWYLTSSHNLQFILGRTSKRKNKDTGEIYYVDTDYYFFSSLEHSLQRIFDMKVMSCDATTLKELFKEIKEIREELKETFTF